MKNWSQSCADERKQQILNPFVFPHLNLLRLTSRQNALVITTS